MKIFTANQSVLLVIDVQGKLAELMHDRDQVVARIQKLINVAQILDVPVILTEQAPDKIGKTLPEIASALFKYLPIKKLSFSCWQNEEFQETLGGMKMRRQIVICGIETHVCVYQTAVDLLGQGFHVQVVVDAVSSRTKENKEIALERLKDFGVGLTCTEMIICELLRTAEHKKFKEIMALIK